MWNQTGPGASCPLAEASGCLTLFQTQRKVCLRENRANKRTKNKANPTPRISDTGASKEHTPPALGDTWSIQGSQLCYVMSLCRGGRWMFRTTHFTIHSMPSRTPLLQRQGCEAGGLGSEDTVGQAPSPPYPVRAEQAWVKQSLRPILQVQSLNAVLMSGIERQVWQRR